MKLFIYILLLSQVNTLSLSSIVSKKIYCNKITNPSSRYSKISMDYSKFKNFDDIINIYIYKYIMKNINNKTLKICSLKPLTGYNRDGYCRPIFGDYGSHLICAKMNKRFLDYSASRGNNLRSVVKEGDNWCLCQDRYYQAYKAKKSPKVIKNATSNKLKSYIKNIFTKKLKGGKLLPKLRKLSKENKKHIYKLYDPQYKRILAMEEGIHQKKNKTKKNKIKAAKMKKARFNVLRLYRKNNDKKGCNNFTKDMKYLDKKYNLGNTKNIC